MGSKRSAVEGNDNMFNKLKSFWKFASEDYGKVRRRKKETRSIRKERNPVLIRRMLWVIIFVVSISGILGYLKAVKAEHATEALMQVSKKNETKTIHQASSQPMVLFGKEFVEKYLNVPKGDKEAYLKELKPYIAQGLSFEDWAQSEAGRDLTSSLYYDVLQERNHVILVYKVSYDNLTEEEATRQKKVKSKQGKKVVTKNVSEKYTKELKTHVNALLYVPVRQSGNRFTVVENPYFQVIPELKSDEASKVINSAEEKGLDEVSAKENEAIEVFANRFFEHYASDSKQDMAYMMKKPESLEGLKQFDEISSFKAYENGRHILVKAEVKFEDKGSSLPDKEVFTLELSKKEGQYFVQKLTHTLD